MQTLLQVNIRPRFYAPGYQAMGGRLLHPSLLRWTRIAQRIQQPCTQPAKKTQLLHLLRPLLSILRAGRAPTALRQHQVQQMGLELKVEQRQTIFSAVLTSPSLLPLSASELLECCDTRTPSRTFTVFDVHHHVRTLAAPVTFTTQQLARLAFSLTPEILVPHDFRVLRKPIPGQDRPQIVLWGADHQHLRTLPVAHPDLATGFCTIAVDSPLSPLQIILEVGRACGTPTADRHSLLKGQTSLQLDFATQDPLRSQDLRRFDHASFQRSPVPGSIVASMLSPAVDHPTKLPNQYQVRPRIPMEPGYLQAPP